MELIVNFSSDIWTVVIYDNLEMIKCLKINPVLDVGDVVSGRVFKKSPMKGNFFFEYKRGITGLLIKASKLKEGDAITAKMLRNEEPPFKSAKFIPCLCSSSLPLFQIEKGKNILLSLIEKYNINSIRCNISKEAEIFKGKASLVKNPFDNIVLDDIASLSEPVVLLKNNARIIIEKTSALTTIDVDSGSSNEDAEIINMTAAKEIVKQLELREIYGQVIIDFIGHSFHKNLAEVIEYLKSKSDTLKFISVTKMNLIEIIKERK